MNDTRRDIYSDYMTKKSTKRSLNYELGLKQVKRTVVKVIRISFVFTFGTNKLKECRRLGIECEAKYRFVRLACFVCRESSFSYSNLQE